MLDFVNIELFFKENVSSSGFLILILDTSRLCVILELTKSKKLYRERLIKNTKVNSLQMQRSGMKQSFN